jgi:Coiled-coil domain-containing protein 24 family
MRWMPQLASLGMTSERSTMSGGRCDTHFHKPQPRRPLLHSSVPYGPNLRNRATYLSAQDSRASRSVTASSQSTCRDRIVAVCGDITRPSTASSCHSQRAEALLSTALEGKHVNVYDFDLIKGQLIEGLESERLALLEDVSRLQEAVNEGLDSQSHNVPSVVDIQVGHMGSSHACRNCDLWGQLSNFLMVQHASLCCCCRQLQSKLVPLPCKLRKRKRTARVLPACVARKPPSPFPFE